MRAQPCKCYGELYEGGVLPRIWCECAGSCREMSTLVMVVRRRWEGWQEADSGRIVLRHPAAENDDESSIRHSGFIRQHSTGDRSGARHRCARGGAATEFSTRCGGTGDPNCGCGGQALMSRAERICVPPKDRTRDYFLDGSSVPEGMRCTLSSPAAGGSTGAAMPRA